MKLIYLTHWRIPSEKTMTPLILKTCEGFVRQGFEVELWVPRRHVGFEQADPFEKHAITTRFPLHRLPVLDLMRFGRFGFLLMVASFNISAYIALRRARKGGDLIVYGHDLRDMLFPCLLGLPLFVEIHDFYESSLRFVNRFVLRRTTGLIVTNSIKQCRLADAYGYPADRMIRQPNAVEVAFFAIPESKEEARRKLSLPQDEKIVLYTGHLFSWKGVDTLADASAFLPENARIYFVGGTVEDREALQKHVRERGLRQITFLPHQEHARIPLFLRAADVLVLPNTAKEEASRVETSPVKLFEYLASGKPIVASDLPSIREIVSDKEVFFFEADNPASLGSVVSEVLTDGAQAGGKASAALSLARQHSWEERARRIHELIDKAVHLQN